jgi:hypothetical protein
MSAPIGPENGHGPYLSQSPEISPHTASQSPGKLPLAQYPPLHQIQLGDILQETQGDTEVP